MTEASATLARSIVRDRSKQTYFTARLLVDRDLEDDFFRGYAYFRWADDVVDLVAGSQDERVTFIDRQRELIDALYRGERPEDLTPEEEMVADLISHDRGQDSGLQSFPSAHTATAAGLAMGLAWLFPRGRWMFSALAALVACQRVVVGAHFPSDTMVGAAVGCVVAACFIDRRVLGPHFDAWEARQRDVQRTTDVPRTSVPSETREIPSVERRRRSA